MLTKEEFREIRREAMKGENNPRWNGGNSDYPNHAELKRIRIEVLKKSKGKCEICGKPAKVVHHIDEDKSNQKIDNLIALCRNCHTPLHCDDEGKSNRGRRPSAKYCNIYGTTIEEIANKFGVTNNAVYYWIKTPEKEKWLKEQLRNRTYRKPGTLPILK